MMKMASGNGDSRFDAHLGFLILAILSRVSPVSAAGNGSFTPLLLANGSAMCATDQPSLKVSVASIMGIPDGVPDAVRCGMVCTGYRGCSSFNYRQSSGGLCEMYTYTPQSCMTTNESCMFYQIKGDIRNCRPYHDFHQINETGTYYTVVPRRLSWFDAMKACLDLSPFAHLVIIKRKEEFEQLQTYLKELPGIENLCTTSSSYGYWTAKRRTNIFAKTQAECFASPLVWAKNNNTDDMLPEQSWESVMNAPGGRPDCYPTSSLAQTCLIIQPLHDYRLNDIYYYELSCPLCQLS